jgi:hypothetical protein
MRLFEPLLDFYFLCEFAFERYSNSKVILSCEHEDRSYSLVSGKIVTSQTGVCSPRSKQFKV